MELLLKAFIHLNSRSNVNILFTGSFQRIAATRISGLLYSFLLSLLFVKNAQTKAIQKVHNK
jgi:hypothetical protein